MKQYITNTKGVYIIYFITLFMLWSKDAFCGSKQVATQALTWTRLTNTLQIDSHWSVYSEADSRIFDSPAKENQVLLRLMARYGFKQGVTLGAGVVGSFNFPSNPDASVFLMTPELRACVDVTIQNRYGIITLNHRNVFENRFVHNASSTELQAGYKYIFRYRYRLQAEFQLWKKNTHILKLILSDEMMLQMGKSIVYNVFDQNRAYAALYYEPFKWLGFEAGYLHQFQQRSTGIDFYSRQIFRFSIHTKIFLKHKN